MSAFPVLRRLNAANVVTSASVVLGLAACELALGGRLGWAVLCGALALPCDVLDGALARRLNQVTAFGGELDSLADALSFCVVPAVLARAMGVSGPWTLGLYLYALAGMWRLAHFAQVGTRSVKGRECFEGLPTAFAAALFYLLAAGVGGGSAGARSAALGGYLALAAVAMIAGFPFPKRGLHTKVLWGLVPVAVVACVVRFW